MLKYYPVMIGWELQPNVQQLVARVMARFKKLNGVEVNFYTEKDFPDPAMHPDFAKVCIWDIVPEDVERVLYMDIDVLALRTMEEIPAAPFVAAPDAAWGAERAFGVWPALNKKDYIFFNPGLFFAERSTRDSFERVKFHRATQSDQLGMYELAPFNLIMNYDYRIHKLPRAWNAQTFNDHGPVADAIFLHLSGGLPTKWTVMKFMLDLLDDKEDPFKVAKMMTTMQAQLKEITGG